MRIKCPKCGKIYDVSENELPAKGRRMRCSGCGEVFWRRPEDADDSFSAWTDEKTNTPDEEPQWNEIKNAVPESEEKDWEEIKVEKNTPPAFEETKEMPSAVTPDDARSEENAPASDNAAEEEESSADEAARISYLPCFIIHRPFSHTDISFLSNLILTSQLSPGCSTGVRENARSSFTGLSAEGLTGEVYSCTTSRPGRVPEFDTVRQTFIPLFFFRTLILS